MMKLAVPMVALVVASTAPVVAGIAGNALLCDGIDDVATIPDGAGGFDFDTTLTVEAWVRFDTLNGKGKAVGGFEGAFALGPSTNAPYPAAFGVSVPATETAVGGALSTGVWTHIAGTFDGVTMRVYVNGVLTGSKAHAGNVTNATKLGFCRFPVDIDSYMHGAIDEVRIWNVTRSPTQIADRYQHPVEPDEPGLIGYYRFDEGSGQILLDSSTAGNDGFLGATSGAGSDDPARIVSGASVVEPGACLRNARTACLLGGRFEVRVEMKNFAHPPVAFPGFIQTYGGQSSETNQSVSFYSFEPGNVEVFVKMVDACSTPGHAFWVFAAGATNAETEILVRDTSAEEVYRIHNPSGNLFETVADTQAFKTCP